MNADKVTIESDERGFELHILDDDGDWHIFNIHAIAEQVYDEVKREIGPWLYEMDQARISRPATLTDAEREEEIRCAAHGLEGPNAKQWRYEQAQ